MTYNAKKIRYIGRVGWHLLWVFGSQYCMSLCVYCKVCYRGTDLTYCGLVTPYGDRDLGQHWLRKWLRAWRHQTITWTDIDWQSVKSSDIHISTISQEMPQPSITKIRLKITHIEFHSNFPGANELTLSNTIHLRIGCSSNALQWFSSACFYRHLHNSFN